MEEIDFSELKMKAGRPVEDSIKKVNLKPYLIESEFKRRFNMFFNSWEEIIKAKAKQRKKYIANMEEYYGEVLEKFHGLSINRQRAVLSNHKPLELLRKLTNLSTPKLFHDEEDNKYFLEEFNNAKL